MASAPSLTFVPTIPEDDSKAELLRFLQLEAENARDTGLDQQRAAAIQAYAGDKYGDEEEGRSQAVTRDVSEVIDFMITGILGTIMAGGKAVEFETEPEQIPAVDPQTGQPQVDPQTQQPVMQEVDYGAQATKAVQYQFFRRQKGYRILHDAVKAAMLEKTGIVKTYAEPQKPVPVQHHVLADEIEHIDGTPHLNGVPVDRADPLDEDWQPGMMSATWAVTVQQTQPPIVRDEAIPNEWFRVSPDTVELDDSPYVGQCTPKSLSDLVAMGYDYDTLKELWDNAQADTIVENARDADRSKTRQSVGRRQGAGRQLWFYEEYPLYDLNDDGIAERLCVHRIGYTILNVMEVDEQPYSGGSPIPMQHRFTGQSLFDKTGDIQRIRTVLMRQALDSLYQSNAPRMLLPEEGTTPDTIDDLLTIRPGALIRYKGGQPPAPLTVTDTSQTAFSAMEMMSNERDGRTGVTRQSQGMNPDSMNKTASGMAMLQQNADQIELYVTRNLVETLVAPMFAKRYRLMKAHQPAFRMKVDGKYQNVDPSQWPDEPDVQINVGIGTGTKDQRIANRDKLLTYAQVAIAGGMRIFSEETVGNMVNDQAEDMGFNYPSRYVVDVSALPPPQPQPDPDMAKAAQQAQLSQQQQEQAHEQAMTRLQLQQQEQQANAALKSQANDQDLQAKREKSALDTELARSKAEAEATLAVRQQNYEMDLSERRFAFDQEMARKKHEQASQSDSTISNDRPGGSLAE